jgi:putative DNA primase/helicase
VGPKTRLFCHNQGYAFHITTYLYYYIFIFYDFSDIKEKVEKLKAPRAVLTATDEYRGEMDVIGNFLKERCIQQKEAMIRIRELYKAYSDWCEENNEHAVSERFLSMRLKEIGYEQSRTSDARYWVGLALQV